MHVHILKAHSSFLNFISNFASSCADGLSRSLSVVEWLLIRGKLSGLYIMLYRLYMSQEVPHSSRILHTHDYTYPPKSVWRSRLVWWVSNQYYSPGCTVLEIPRVFCLIPYTEIPRDIEVVTPHVRGLRHFSPHSSDSVNPTPWQSQCMHYDWLTSSKDPLWEEFAFVTVT